MQPGCMFVDVCLERCVGVETYAGCAGCGRPASISPTISHRFQHLCSGDRKILYTNLHHVQLQRLVSHPLGFLVSHLLSRYRNTCWKIPRSFQVDITQQHYCENFDDYDRAFSVIFIVAMLTCSRFSYLRNSMFRSCLL
jgi:hypothetical protein